MQHSTVATWTGSCRDMDRKLPGHSGSGSLIYLERRRKTCPVTLTVDVVSADTLKDVLDPPVSGSSTSTVP